MKKMNEIKNEKRLTKMFKPDTFYSLACDTCYNSFCILLCSFSAYWQGRYRRQTRRKS